VKLRALGGLTSHLPSHSCKPFTKPELGLTHARWRFTWASALSNDMPRFRIKKAITIAGLREIPYTCSSLVFVQGKERVSRGNGYGTWWQ
jgi:hypothetical protein